MFFIVYVYVCLVYPEGSLLLAAQSSLYLNNGFHFVVKHIIVMCFSNVC